MCIRDRGRDYETVDVSVAPAGVIRGSFGKGRITAADAFNALSLGTGKDGVAGYPLVSVYLTGAELKLAAEIDASVSNIMQPARLYLSGLKMCIRDRLYALFRLFVKDRLKKKGVPREKWEEKTTFEESVMTGEEEQN